MPLSPGVRLGSYEVLAPLGGGGMGEVYRARDTKLGREVALKLLVEEVAHDPERLARFRREARVLAALNHPGIAAIHGFEEADGKPFLVLELADGEDLSERLKRGPLPVAEAVVVARQVAEALEEAHEHGIVHRDLKPANIKLAPQGKVKVLDFGLAKAYADDDEGAPSLSDSPTRTRATEVGRIMGTAAYMSPEQARGRPADTRSDLWALGVVLYEMLTGARLFSGGTVSEILASVMRDEPDWERLPPGTPAAVRRLLKRCLEKDAKNRLHAAADARLELAEAHEDNRGTGTEGGATTSRRRRIAPWLAGFAALVGIALWAPWRTEPKPARVLRFDVRLGPGLTLGREALRYGPAAVLSQAGDLLAFVGEEGDGPARIYTRRLDELQASPLAGTEGAHTPFLSPDGRSIAFFAGGRLKTISTGGGPAVTLCEAPIERGGTWGTKGEILFAPDASSGGFLSQVSASGGPCGPVTQGEDGEVTHRWPQWLPGHAVLYTAHSALGAYDGANLVIQTLPGGPRKVVHRNGYHGRYLPTGHLAFVHEGTLFAVPFDLGAREKIGAAVPLVAGVFAHAVYAGAQFALSEEGTLVYVAGDGVADAAPIHWLTREGTTTLLRGEPVIWANPRFSPSGDRLAMTVNDGRQWDVWVYDLARDALARLTNDPRTTPRPSGRRTAEASSSRPKGQERRTSTGRVPTAAAIIQRLTQRTNIQDSPSWHPSGRMVAFNEARPGTNDDLMTFEVVGDEKAGYQARPARIFLATPFGESNPAFSPDGQWLAYASDESGRAEVYVRPFPDAGGKWQVSAGGGDAVVWSRTRPKHQTGHALADSKGVLACLARSAKQLRTREQEVGEGAREPPLLRHPREATECSGQTTSSRVTPSTSRIKSGP